MLLGRHTQSLVGSCCHQGFAGHQLCAQPASLPRVTGPQPLLVEAKDVTRRERRRIKHASVRRKVTGVEGRPRLAVFRSHLHIYAQVIDDTTHNTLVSASTLQPAIKQELNNKGSTKDAATLVGKKIAELCKEKDISRVCFDRGGFIYHGRVQALADAAREGGLAF